MKMILIILFLSDFLLGISEESIPIVWHSKRWWNFCMSEDEKKEIKPIFTK